MNIKFYQVGGCVRDQLMGLKSKDIDYCVEAPSFEDMREAVINRGCDIKVEKPEYVTIRAIDPILGGVDFVLCRKEGKYSDGRRPDSVTVGTLMDDLSRRDFTCNAIAKDDEGNIHDPFAGLQAIEEKILICVGSVERLREDSLRMIRAIRFAITKGFLLHPSIIEFLSDEGNVKLLRNVSPQRITEELNRCFAFDPYETISVFQSLNNHLLKELFCLHHDHQSCRIRLEATLKCKPKA